MLGIGALRKYGRMSGSVVTTTVSGVTVPQRVFQKSRTSGRGRRSWSDTQSSKTMKEVTLLARLWVVRKASRGSREATRSSWYWMKRRGWAKRRGRAALRKERETRDTDLRGVGWGALGRRERWDDPMRWEFGGVGRKVRIRPMISFGREGIFGEVMASGGLDEGQYAAPR